MIIHNVKNCNIKEDDKYVLKNGGIFLLITIFTIIIYACVVLPVGILNEKKITGTDNKTEAQFKIILKDKYIDDEFVQSINQRSWNSYEVYDSNMKKHKIIWKEVK